MPELLSPSDQPWYLRRIVWLIVIGSILSAYEYSRSNPAFVILISMVGLLIVAEAALFVLKKTGRLQPGSHAAGSAGGYPAERTDVFPVRYSTFFPIFLENIRKNKDYAVKSASKETGIITVRINNGLFRPSRTMTVTLKDRGEETLVHTLIE